jgi:hypothetical protein
MIQKMSSTFSLDIRGCTGISDVNMLGKVHTLDMSLREGVTDITALSTVITLINRQ